MSKILIIFSLILSLVSCNVKPDGYDNKGYYVYKDSCIRSHKVRSTNIVYTGKVMIPVTSTRNKCDSIIKVKIYVHRSRIIQ